LASLMLVRWPGTWIREKTLGLVETGRREERRRVETSLGRVMLFSGGRSVETSLGLVMPEERRGGEEEKKEDLSWPRYDRKEGRERRRGPLLASFSQKRGEEEEEGGSLLLVTSGKEKRRRRRRLSSPLLLLSLTRPREVLSTLLLFSSP